MTSATSGAARRLREMDADECWTRLRGAQVGRLAFASPAVISVLPLNFVVREDRLMFLTTRDAGLLAPQTVPVSFEIDGWDARAAWSVVATGRLERTTEPLQLELEAELGMAPWAPPQRSALDTVVALLVDGVSGRAFSRRRWQGRRWSW